MSRHSGGSGGGVGITGLHSSLSERFHRHIRAGDWQSCLRLLHGCVATCHDYTTLPCASVIPFLVAHQQWREVLRLQPALLRASATNEARDQASVVGTQSTLIPTSTGAAREFMRTTATRSSDDAAALLVSLAAHGHVAERANAAEAASGSSPRSDLGQLLSVWLLALLEAPEAVAEAGCAAGVALLCRVAMTRNARLSTEAVRRAERVVAGWCAQSSRFTALTPPLLQELQLAQDYLRAELGQRGQRSRMEETSTTDDTGAQAVTARDVVGAAGLDMHVVRLLTDLLSHNATDALGEAGVRRGRRAVLRQVLRQFQLLAHTALASPRRLAKLVYTLSGVLQAGDGAEDGEATVGALRAALHTQPALGEAVCRTALIVLMAQYRARRAGPSRQGGHNLLHTDEGATLFLACLTICCLRLTCLSQVQRAATEAGSEVEGVRAALSAQAHATSQLVGLVRDCLDASTSLPASQSSTECAALDAGCVRQLQACLPRHVVIAGGDVATAQASLLPLTGAASLVLLHELMSALVRTHDAIERAAATAHVTLYRDHTLYRDGAATLVRLVQYVYKHHVEDGPAIAEPDQTGRAQERRLYAVWSILLDADPAAFLDSFAQKGLCRAREQLLLSVLQRSECGANMLRDFNLTPSPSPSPPGDARLAPQQPRFSDAVQLTARLVLQLAALLPRPRSPAGDATSSQQQPWIAEDASYMNCPLADTSPQDFASDSAPTALAWAVPSETLNGPSAPTTRRTVTPSPLMRRRDVAVSRQLGYSVESIARQLVWWALQVSSPAGLPRRGARHVTPALRVYLHALPSRPRTALCLRLLDALPTICTDVVAASGGSDATVDAEGLSAVAAVLVAALQQPDAALALAEQAACVRRGLAQVAHCGGASKRAMWRVALRFLRECPVAYYHQHESAVTLHDFVPEEDEQGQDAAGEQGRQSGQSASAIARGAPQSSLAQLLCVLVEETSPPRWFEALAALHRATPSLLLAGVSDASASSSRGGGGEGDARHGTESSWASVDAGRRDDLVEAPRSRLTRQERDALWTATRRCASGATMAPVLRLYRRLVGLKRDMTAEELTWLAPVVHHGSPSFAAHVLGQLHGEKSTPLGLAALRCAARCHARAASMEHVPVVLTKHRCYALGMQALRCLALTSQMHSSGSSGSNDSSGHTASTPSAVVTQGDFGVIVRCVGALAGRHAGPLRRVLLQSGLWAADGVLGAAVRELRQTVQLCRDGDDAVTALQAYTEYRRAWHGAPVPAAVLLQLMHLECGRLQECGTALDDGAAAVSDTARVADEAALPAASDEVQTRWHTDDARRASSPIASLVMLLRDGCMQTAEVVYASVPEMQNIAWQAFLPAAPASLARFLPAALSILLGSAEETLVRDVDKAYDAMVPQRLCVATPQPAALVEANAALLLSECLPALRHVRDGTTVLRSVSCLIVVMEALQLRGARRMNRAQSPAVLSDVARRLIGLLTRRREQTTWSTTSDAALCGSLDACLYRLYLVRDAAAALARLVDDDDDDRNSQLDNKGAERFARLVRDTTHARRTLLQQQLAALTLPFAVSRAEKARGVARVVRVWSTTILSPLALHVAALQLVLTMWQDPPGQAIACGTSQSGSVAVCESSTETLHGLATTTRLLAATHRLLCNDELAMSVVHCGQFRQAAQSVLRGARYRLQCATECVARYLVEWWLDSLEDVHAAALLAAYEERAVMLWLVLQLTTLLCVATAGQRPNGAAAAMRGVVERLERVLQAQPSVTAQQPSETERRVEQCVIQLLLACTTGTQKQGDHNSDGAIDAAWRALGAGGEKPPGAQPALRPCYARLVWLATLPSLFLLPRPDMSAQGSSLSVCAEAMQALMGMRASPAVDTQDTPASPLIEALVLVHAASHGALRGSLARWSDTATRMQDSVQAVLAFLATPHLRGVDAAAYAAVVVGDSSEDSLDAMQLIESSAVLLWLRCAAQPWCKDDLDSRTSDPEGKQAPANSASQPSACLLVSVDQAREEPLQRLLQSLSLASPERTMLASLLIQYCPLPASTSQALFIALTRRLTLALRNFGPWPICRRAQLTMYAVEAARLGGHAAAEGAKEKSIGDAGATLRTTLEAVTPVRVRWAVPRGAYAVPLAHSPLVPSLASRHDEAAVAVLYELHTYARGAAMATARVLLGQADAIIACGPDEGIAVCGAAVQQWAAMLRPELARRPPVASLLRALLRDQASKTICLLDGIDEVAQDDSMSAVTLLLQSAGVLEDAFTASTPRRWHFSVLQEDERVDDAGVGRRASAVPFDSPRAFAYPASRFTMARLLLPPTQGLRAEAQKTVDDALCAPWRRLAEHTKGGDDGCVVHVNAPHESRAERSGDDASLLVRRGAFSAVQYAATQASALPSLSSPSSALRLLVRLAGEPHTQAVLQRLHEYTASASDAGLTWWCAVWNVTLVRLAELTRDARLHGRQAQCLQDHRRACEVVLCGSALTTRAAAPLLRYDVLGYWLTSFVEEVALKNMAGRPNAVLEAIEAYMESASPELRAALTMCVSLDASQDTMLSHGATAVATTPPLALADLLQILLRALGESSDDASSSDGAWWVNSVWPPLFRQRAALARLVGGGAGAPGTAKPTVRLCHPLALCEALEGYMSTPYARAKRAEAVRHLVQAVQGFIDTGACHVEGDEEARFVWRSATDTAAALMAARAPWHLRGTGGALVLDTLLRLLYTTHERGTGDTMATQSVLEAIFPSLVGAQGDTKPRDDYTGYVPLSWNVLPPMLVAYVGSKKRRSATAEHVVCVLQRLHEMAAATTWLASRCADTPAAATADDAAAPLPACFVLTPRDASHLLTLFLAALTQAMDFVTPLGWHAERQATLHAAWTALLALLTLLVRGECGALADGNVWSVPLTQELRRLFGDDVTHIVSSCEAQGAVGTTVPRTLSGEARRFVSPRALLHFFAGAWRHGDNKAVLSRMLRSLLSYSSMRSMTARGGEEVDTREEVAPDGHVDLAVGMREGSERTTRSVWHVRLDLPPQDRHFPWLQIAALLRRGLVDHGLLPTHGTLTDLLELALSHAVRAAGDATAVAVSASYAMGGVAFFEVVAPYMLLTPGMHETLWLLLLFAAGAPHDVLTTTVVAVMARVLRRFQSVELTPVCVAAMARLYARLADLDASRSSPVTGAQATRSMLLWRIVRGLRALNALDYSKVVLVLGKAQPDSSRPTIMNTLLRDTVDYLATDPHRQTAYDEAFIEAGTRLFGSCATTRSPQSPCAALLQRVLLTMAQRRSVGSDRRRQVPRSRALSLYARYSRERADEATDNPWPRLCIHVYLLTQCPGEASLLSWRHTMHAVLWPAVRVWRGAASADADAVVAAEAKTAAHAALIHQAAMLTLQGLCRAEATEADMAEALCTLWDVVMEIGNVTEPAHTTLSALYEALRRLAQMQDQLGRLSLHEVLLPKLRTLQTLQQREREEKRRDKGAGGGATRAGLNAQRACNRLAVLAHLARCLAVRPTLSPASAVELAACLEALQAPLRAAAVVREANVADAHNAFCQAYLRRLDKSACYEQMLRFVVQTSCVVTDRATHAMLTHACSIVLPAAMTEALTLLLQPTLTTREEALRTLEHLLQVQRVSTTETHMRQLRRALHDGAICDAVELCRRHRTLLHGTAMTLLCCELVARQNGAIAIANFVTTLLTAEADIALDGATEAGKDELQWLRPPAASLALLTALTRGFVQAHRSLAATPPPPQRVLWAGAQVVAMLLLSVGGGGATSVQDTTLRDGIAALQVGLVWLGQQLLRDRHMCDDDAPSVLTCFWTGSTVGNDHDARRTALKTLASVVAAHVLPTLQQGDVNGARDSDESRARTNCGVLDASCQRCLVRLLARSYPHLARQLWDAMAEPASRMGEHAASLVAQFFADYCDAVDACMALLRPPGTGPRGRQGAPVTRRTHRPVTRDALDAVVQWRERAMFGGVAAGQPYRVLAHFVAATEVLQSGCSATRLAGVSGRLFAVRLTHLARVAELLVACHAPLLFTEVALHLLYATSAEVRGGGLPFALAEATQVFLQAADKLCNDEKDARGQLREGGVVTACEASSDAWAGSRLGSSSPSALVTNSPMSVAEACVWNRFAVEVLHLLSCAPTASDDAAVTLLQPAPTATTLPLSTVTRLLRLLTSTAPMQWPAAHRVSLCGECEMRFVSLVSVAQHLLRAVMPRELRRHEAAVALAQAVMVCLRRSYLLAARAAATSVSRATDACHVRSSGSSSASIAAADGSSRVTAEETSLTADGVVTSLWRDGLHLLLSLQERVHAQDLLRLCDTDAAVGAMSLLLSSAALVRGNALAACAAMQELVRTMQSHALVVLSEQDKALIKVTCITAYGASWRGHYAAITGYSPTVVCRPATLAPEVEAEARRRLTAALRLVTTYRQAWAQCALKRDEGVRLTAWHYGALLNLLLRSDSPPCGCPAGAATARMTPQERWDAVERWFFALLRDGLMPTTRALNACFRFLARASEGTTTTATTTEAPALSHGSAVNVLHFAKLLTILPPITNLRHYHHHHHHNQQQQQTPSRHEAGSRMSETSMDGGKGSDVLTEADDGLAMAADRPDARLQPSEKVYALDSYMFKCVVQACEEVCSHDVKQGASGPSAQSACDMLRAFVCFATGFSRMPLLSVALVDRCVSLLADPARPRTEAPGGLQGGGPYATLCLVWKQLRLHARLPSRDKLVQLYVATRSAQSHDTPPGSTLGMLRGIAKAERLVLPPLRATLALALAERPLLHRQHGQDGPQDTAVLLAEVDARYARVLRDFVPATSSVFVQAVLEPMHSGAGKDDGASMVYDGEDAAATVNSERGEGDGAVVSSSDRLSESLSVFATLLRSAEADVDLQLAYRTLLLTLLARRQWATAVRWIFGEVGEVGHDGTGDWPAASAQDVARMTTTTAGASTTRQDMPVDSFVLLRYWRALREQLQRDSVVPELGSQGDAMSAAATEARQLYTLVTRCLQRRVMRYAEAPPEQQYNETRVGVLTHIAMAELLRRAGDAGDVGRPAAGHDGALHNTRV